MKFVLLALLFTGLEVWAGDVLQHTNMKCSQARQFAQTQGYLDYYWDWAPHEIQREYFWNSLEACTKWNLKVEYTTTDKRKCLIGCVPDIDGPVEGGG